MQRLVIAAALVLVLASTAGALDITACDQTVPAGEVGRLIANVTCTTELTGVALERGATLELNGFSLGGGTNIGVACLERACTVVGPGTIDGNWMGVSLLVDRVTLTISDVTIRNGKVAILGSARQHDRARVNATNVTIENPGDWAISAAVIRAEGLTVTGAGPTLYAVIADRLLGSAIAVTGNQAVGIQARKVKASSLTAIANDGTGVDAGRAVLGDSTLTGNGVVSGVDLRSARRPRVVNTVCGLSADAVGGNWGVCTND
jgi:hypothetical protein